MPKSRAMAVVIAIALIVTSAASGAPAAAENQVTVEAKWRFAPTVTAVADSTSVRLSWDEVPGAARYATRWRTGSAKFSAWQQTTERSAALTELTPATTYTVLVRAHVAGGWKAYTRVDITTSTSVTGSTAPPTTAAPTTTAPATTTTTTSPATTTTTPPTTSTTTPPRPTTTTPATTIPATTTPATTAPPTTAPATTAPPTTAPPTTAPPTTTAPSGSGSGQRPDIVLLITDDQSVEDMQWMPWTQRWFERNGAAITNHRTALPWCCPNRASIQSGRYAHNHGVWSNDPGYGAFDTSSTIATWLDPTYQTVHIGKALNNTGDAIPPGWDHWCATVNGDHRMYRWKTHCKVGNARATTTSYGSGPANFQGTVYADMAEHVIATADEPLLLYFSMSAPHVGPGRLPEPHPSHKNTVSDPLPVPPNWKQPSNYSVEELTVLYRRRAESLKGADDQVRQLITALDRAGRLDNTVLMFISDNGFLLGEHGVVGKNIWWSEAVDIPAYIAGPGVRPGSVIDEMTSTVDIASTIAAIAGATPTIPVDGVDLRGAIDDDRAVLIEGRRLTDNTPSWWSLETPRWMYMERAGKGSGKLFDKATDPHQLRNLFTNSQYRRLRDALSDVLRARRNCDGRACVFSVDSRALAALAGVEPVTTTPPTTLPPTPTTTVPPAPTTTAPTGGTVTTLPPTPTTSPSGAVTITAAGSGIAPGFTLTIRSDGAALLELVPTPGAKRFQVRWRGPSTSWQWTGTQASTRFEFTVETDASIFEARAYINGRWQPWVRARR